MNEPNTPQPPFLPTPPKLTPPPALPAPSPADQVPIHGLFGSVEAILREPRRVMFQLGQPGNGSIIGALLLIAIVSVAVYGLIVGTFSGGMQLWAAPAKIAAGLLVSALICLPSLFIFACLGGSTARVAEVFGILSGKLALTTILLIGFAPVAWVFSQSTQSIVAMGVLHLIFWAIAVIFGLRFMHHAFAYLVQSGAGIKVWTVIYLLVALQMTCALRPLLGTSDTFLPTEKKFFLTHWLETMSASRTDAPTDETR